MTKAIEDYKSPTHKILAMLYKGRDTLRAKYREHRTKLRVLENQVRAVEASRLVWRERAETAEAVLKKMGQRI
jgi:hypothetical protein